VEEGTVDGKPAEYACSFCGKHKKDVKRMIAGPRGVFICNECIDLCNKIIAEEEASAGTQ
jgi:ATP-dependent Clp protease ATP-binding subunit ClpX